MRDKTQTCEQTGHKAQDLFLKTRKEALAGWLSWLECHPKYQEGVGSIPGQGVYGGDPSRLLSQLDVCLSVSPPHPFLPLSRGGECTVSTLTKSLREYSRAGPVVTFGCRIMCDYNVLFGLN